VTTDVDALVAAVAANPYDVARQAALADYLQEHPDRIPAAVFGLAEWVDMSCPWCKGNGGDLFSGACDRCNGSGRRTPK
jgi:uncharacterized protein (TIGR02996 family)